MDILQKIVAYKKEEVAAQREKIPVIQLERGAYFDRQTLSLKRFLLDKTKTGIIAEFKRQSPSKGIINNRSTVAEVTSAYALHGASGISVLTDGPSFGGSLQDLATARMNAVPLLRKEFVIDEYQVIEAKAYGADVVLLIAACLSVSEVKSLSSIAQSLGLEVLLEIHDETELDHMGDHIHLVGVNNRNLKTFAVDIETSIRLFPHIPSSKLAVTESGIGDVETIVTLRRAGFRGFLMGEAFMKAPQPAIAFDHFIKQLKAKICD